ncbi:hypothetical protein WAI453_001185 [Rhynchosporium graminicola]
MLAAKHNYVAEARLFPDKRANINHVSALGETALVMAIGENYSGAFHLPVDYGVDLLQCVELGNNPLIIAAKYGHLNIVKFFLTAKKIR